METRKLINTVIDENGDEYEVFDFQGSRVFGLAKGVRGTEVTDTTRVCCNRCQAILLVSDIGGHRATLCPLNPADRDDTRPMLMVEAKPDTTRPADTSVGL